MVPPSYTASTPPSASRCDAVVITSECTVLSLSLSAPSSSIRLHLATKLASLIRHVSCRLEILTTGGGSSPSLMLQPHSRPR
eukprot:3439925-Rhodomonas_salina.4